MKKSLPFTYITAVKSGKHYVVFDYKDENGKRKRKWVSTHLPEKCAKKTLKSAIDTIVADFYEEFVGGKPKTNSRAEKKGEPKEDENSILFADYLRHWIKSVKPTIEETSYNSYCVAIKKALAFFEGNYPNIRLSEVTAFEIQEYYNFLSSKGLSPTSVKQNHVVIHKLLKDAVKLDLIPGNESEKTKRPKAKKFEASFYNKDELDKLFEVFKGDRIELVVIIAAYYGLRRSEIIGLRWDSVDFDKKCIRVHEKAYCSSENGKTIVKFTPTMKTKSSCRTLPLIPYIEKLLLAKKENDRLMAKNLKSAYCHDFDDYICTDNFGNLITPNYVTTHFCRMIKKNNLKKLRFHDLRHSCASLLLANDVPMKAIQEWLGHSTFQVTADFYSHLEYNSKLASAETIASVLGGEQISMKQDEE